MVVASHKVSSMRRGTMSLTSLMKKSSKNSWLWVVITPEEEMRSRLITKSLQELHLTLSPRSTSLERESSKTGRRVDRTRGLRDSFRPSATRPNPSTPIDLFSTEMTLETTGTGEGESKPNTQPVIKTKASVQGRRFKFNMDLGPDKGGESAVA